MIQMGENEKGRKHLEKLASIMKNPMLLLFSQVIDVITVFSRQRKNSNPLHLQITHGLMGESSLQIYLDLY